MSAANIKQTAPPLSYAEEKRKPMPKQKFARSILIDAVMSQPANLVEDIR